MNIARGVRSIALDVIALVIAGIVFVVPFVFILLTAAKDRGLQVVLNRHYAPGTSDWSSYATWAHSVSTKICRSGATAHRVRTRG